MRKIVISLESSNYMNVIAFYSKISLDLRKCYFLSKGELISIRKIFDKERQDKMSSDGEFTYVQW